MKNLINLADCIKREPLSCRFGFHKWTIWTTPYQVAKMYRWTSQIGYEQQQKRYCLKCQREEVREIY